VALPPKGCSPDQCAATADNAAWDPARLQAAAAAAAAALGVPSGVQAASAPDAAASAQFGVLVLAHERGVPAAQAWAAWADAHAGRVAVGVHLKAGVACAGLPGASWLAARQLRTRVDSRWGCVSLTAAVLAGAADMLAQHPGLAHLAVVSGQDVPVALLPRELPPGLSMVGCFQFGAAFDAAAGAAAAQLLRQALGMAAAEARAWAESLTFHHTWMVLDRWAWARITGQLQGTHTLPSCCHLTASRRTHTRAPASPCCPPLPAAAHARLQAVAAGAAEQA
jgi:hypothetical protein